MNKVWYYEYKVIVVWGWEDPEEKEYSGIVPATSLTNAVQKLEDFYSNNIINILTLKDIVEGEVFEFNNFQEDEASNAGFIITKKE